MQSTTFRPTSLRSILILSFILRLCIPIGVFQVSAPKPCVYFSLTMHATYPSNLIFFYFITPVILARSKNSGAPWSSFCVFTVVKIACVIFILIWLTIKWPAQLPFGLETTTHLFSVGGKTGNIVCWIFISGFQSNCYQYFTTYCSLHPDLDLTDAGSCRKSAWHCPCNNQSDLTSDVHANEWSFVL